VQDVRFHCSIAYYRHYFIVTIVVLTAILETSLCFEHHTKTALPPYAQQLQVWYAVM